MENQNLTNNLNFHYRVKVLMISIDRGLLGKDQLGDVIERHAEYGKHVEKLDIIVFTKTGFEPYSISSNVKSYPTNSFCKLKYACDAKKIGKKLFKENNYNLIVTQEPFLTGLAGYCLKRKFKVRLLVHFHGDFWKNKNWLKESKLNWLFLIISKFVVSKADAIRVMSEGQKEKLGKYQNKARVISTPVELEKFNLNFNKPNSKYVLHVGRSDKVKDYDTLVKAFDIVNSKITNVNFLQRGGRGELISAMDRQNNISLGVNSIDAKGKTDQNELIRIYHLSDVVVSSSTSESFGKVLVEANACGKPVVSTATTGAKEIIKDGYNGYLVPIGDYQKLAEKIIYLLNNPDKAQEMGENGKKLVAEKFGNNTQEIINYWKEIING